MQCDAMQLKHYNLKQDDVVRYNMIQHMGKSLRSMKSIFIIMLQWDILTHKDQT